MDKKILREVHEIMDTNVYMLGVIVFNLPKVPMDEIKQKIMEIQPFDEFNFKLEIINYNPPNPIGFVSKLFKFDGLVYFKNDLIQHDDLINELMDLNGIDLFQIDENNNLRMVVEV